jgi:hypothetical protein
MFWREIGIAHRLVYLFVSERFLHSKQINASHNEIRGKGVPKGHGYENLRSMLLLQPRLKAS